MSEDPNKVQRLALNALIVNWFKANNWLNIKDGKKKPPPMKTILAVGKKRDEYKKQAESLASTLKIENFECKADNKYAKGIWSQFTAAKSGLGGWEHFPDGFVTNKKGLYVPPKRARSESFGDSMDVDEMDAFSFMDYPQHYHHVDHIYDQQPVTYLHDGSGSGSNADYSLILAILPGLMVGLCLLLVFSCIIGGMIGYFAGKKPINVNRRKSRYESISRSDKDYAVNME